jgi:hypothetical protein
MAISKRQLALLHALVTRFGIPEADYRRGLLLVGGVTSAKELTPQGFASMVALLEYWGHDARKPVGQDFGDRPGMASYAQLELIRQLWREFTDFAHEGEAELETWLLRHSKVSALRFLTGKQAQKLIAALMAMRRRRMAG